MKYSYPDSLIRLSAALAMACSYPRYKYGNQETGINRKDSINLKFNTKQRQGISGVGIKFDNISAGKYFALINRIKQSTH